jgi:hypothetical protein
VDADRLLDFVRRTPSARLSPARVLSLPSPEGEAMLPELGAWLGEFGAGRVLSAKS